MNTSPKVLILATSYAQELHHPHNETGSYPRTDYIELSKRLNCDIIDYSFYDNHPSTARCRNIEKKSRMDFSLAIAGYRRAPNYDVVLLMSERVAIPYAFLTKCFGMCAETVFLSMHSSRRQARIIKSLRLSNQFSRTVSFTPAQKRFLTSDMNIAEESISYVPYAVDNCFFGNEQTSRDGFILSAGGIPGRDYGTLINAIRGTNIPLRIISGGRWYGRNTSGDLDQIPDNVKLLSGFTSKQMKELYSKASLVVVPLKKDRADAAGTSVVLEAMSAASPLIVSASPGIKHYLNNNVDSILVDPENSTTLREAISTLMSDCSKCNLLGAHAQKSINDQLTLQHYVERLQRVICGEILGWPLNT